MSELTRKIIDSLMPPGSAWTPAIEDDFNRLLEGKADNLETVIAFMASLADIRNPLKTPVLSELEKEFGITANLNFSEQQRREFLNTFIFSGIENGTAEELELRLQQAGFNVQVHANDPAGDPEEILNENFKVVAGGGNAYAGRDDAFARRVGGELIVNGDVFKQIPQYQVVAGGGNAYAGIDSFNAGVFDKFLLFKIEYQIPQDPNDWPFMFYIGGDETRDGNDKIVAVERVVLPLEVREEFLNIILKYKPIYTWGISVVDFI